MMAGTGVEGRVWFGVYREVEGQETVRSIVGSGFMKKQDCLGGVSGRGVSGAGPKAEPRLKAVSQKLGRWPEPGNKVG